MALVGPLNPTLLDWAERLDPDGGVADIIEILNQQNEVLMDMTWKEGNLPTGNRTTIRTGLPAVAWRLLNNGVQPSKSTTVQNDDSCGMLEAWCEVDKDLAMLNGNTAEFRMSENLAFIEGMNQAMAQTLFYGNTTVNPERYLGLAPRYSSKTAENGINIVDAGGTSTVNTSIWLVYWGPNTVQGIFPKGSEAGLIHQDLGEVTSETANGTTGTRMRVFQDRWQWKCGISLRDWRACVRIANIDTTILSTATTAPTFPGTGTTPADIIVAMIRAQARIPKVISANARPAFYVNRTIAEFLRIQALQKSQNILSIEDAQGQLTVKFLGIPIRCVDALLSTEARVQ